MPRSVVLGYLATSIDASRDALPSRIRLFHFGVNTTENGDFIFDEAAAREVMAAYRAHGVELMIDLEHLSLDPDAKHYDPDARGWSALELADDGLYLAGVRWLADGERRLREGLQRYLSPAFLFDEETGRVTKLINVAITALPATHGIQAVASRRIRRLAMDPQQLVALAEALGLDAGATVEDILAAVGGLQKKLQDALAGNAEPSGEKKAPGPPPPEEGAPPDESAASRLRALAGVDSNVALESVVARWRADSVELASAREKLAKDRAQLEASERHALVVDLVRRCGEPPATAWADATAVVPAEPWASMPLAQLRARVEALSKTSPSGIRPASPAGLTEREAAICKEKGCDPKVFSAIKSRLTGRS